MKLSEKQAIVQSIDDETGELHDILKSVLPLRPNVTEVAYTHGQQEFGADFIVSILNETIGRTRFVGVVAKTKKIVQDFRDVDIQIEECFVVPRLFHAGRQEIYITEVWVLTTKTISNNAQAKIRQKYKDKNIEFLDYSVLVDWIDEHIPVYWDRLPPNLSVYVQEWRSKITEAQNNSSFAGFEYTKAISPKFTTGRFGDRREVKIDEVTKYAKAVFIEGDLGSGKSTCLRNLYLEKVSDNRIIENKQFPVFARYTDIVLQHECQLEKVWKAYVPEKVEAEANKINGLSRIFFIDAVDESGDQYETAKEVIEKLIESSRKDDKFIFAGRPICDFDDFDIANVVPIRIAPLKPAEIISLLKSSCGAGLPENIYRDLAKSGVIREVATTPIAAIMISTIIRANKRELPSTLTELFSKYTELVLGRWEIEKGLKNQQEFEISQIVLGKLAEFVFSNRILGVSRSEFNNAFKAYLSERHFDIDPDQLAEKTIARSNLLVIDSETGNICFRHRSFLEYFYAHNSFVNKGLEATESAFLPSCSTIYFFYLGLKKEAPELLEKLASIDSEDEMVRWSKIVCFGQYLMSAYHTKYDVAINSLVKIFMELAEFHSQVRSNNTESPFNQIPPVGLVAFLQHMIIGRYDYEYLKSALIDAKTQIELSETDADLKMFSLFFISCAIDGAGNGEEKNKFVEKYASSLPQELKLYLGMGANRGIFNGAAIKSLGKRIDESLKSNPKRNSLLESYFSTPINGTPSKSRSRLPIKGSRKKR